MATFRWPNSDCFFGDFIHGKRNGKGTLVLANGNKYDGDFMDDNLCGLGIYIWGQSGLRYDGMWKENKMHGFGKMSENGIYRYDGNWVNGKMHGKGGFEFIVSFFDNIFLFF